MDSEFLVILLFTSVFSYAYSEGDDFSSLDRSKFVEPLNTNEAELGRYLSSQDLEHLISKLELHNRIVKYHGLLTYTDIPAKNNSLDKSYGKIVKSKLIGTSAVDEKPIHAVEISHDVMEPRKLLKPMFKFVANIHGDDAVGYAMMVSLMKYLVYHDGYDDRINDLLENIDIWIVPTLNPDGLSRSKKGRCDSQNDFKGKFNGNGVDLDLDFPDKLEPCKRNRQSETNSMIRFIKENPFVLSGNLQGGAIEASYPLDYSNKPTQDDEIFKKLANDYAEKNPMMARKNKCNKSFLERILSGNLWRKERGGMQDANYILSNCFEISLFLGCCKYPKSRDLLKYWHANLESMLNFIESTRQGIFGLVTNQRGYPVSDAVIAVKGKEKEIKATDRGEYWRLLVPDQYNVTASAPGCSMKTQTVLVTKNHPYVQLDFVLTCIVVHGRVELLSYDKNIKKDIFIKVLEENIEVKVAKNGEYFIPLRVGEYTITTKAPGYYMRTDKVNVTEDNPDVELDIVLMRPKLYIRVEDTRGKPLKQGTVKVIERNQAKSVTEFNLSENGDLWMWIELDKSYVVIACASGYIQETKSLDLTQNSTNVKLTFVLKRKKCFKISVSNKNPNGH